MTGYSLVRDPGAYGTTDVAFDPQSLGIASTANGRVIDRFASTAQRGQLAACASLIAGAASGGPSAVSSTLILQHSSTSDFSSDVSTLEDNSQSTAGVSVTAAQSSSPVGRWDLQRAKRYIRFSVTNALTGGTAMNVSVSGFISNGEIS